MALDNGLAAPESLRAPRAMYAEPSSTAKAIISVLMVLLLVAAIAGVVVALSSGMPTVALVIALVTGAVFAGSLC